MTGPSILVVGDTNLQAGSVPDAAFAHVAALMRDAAAVIGQHEGLFSDVPEVAEIPQKPLWRHAPAAMAQALRCAGFRAVSLASNVASPARQIAGTVATLDAAGVAHAGIGRDREAARAPARIEVAGVRLGLLSYTSVFWPVGHAATADAPGCATIRAHTAYEPGRRALEMPGDPPLVVTWADPAELAAMRDDVARLRPQVDLVLVSCHWGVSGSAATLAYQREIAQAAVAAGADLVFGHHPHVIQGAELIDGRPVFYSLGNFVFDWPVMRGRHLDGLVLQLASRPGAAPAVEVVPVRREPDDNVVRVHSGEDAQGRRILAGLVELSRSLGTTVRITAHGATLVP
jgi:poly-gamma-glutamate capsule biosynthesis protein CapA/YwtB (metallophosphatase superfamily)